MDIDCAGAVQGRVESRERSSEAAPPKVPCEQPPGGPPWWGGWGQQGQVGAAARCTRVQQRLELRSILNQVHEEAVNAKAE